MATVAVLLSGVGVASAQTSTTTTGENRPTDQGASLHTYLSGKDYQSLTDPIMNPRIGVVLPNTVTLQFSLDTVKGPSADRSRYGMVNNHPVVVESADREVVHTWDKILVGDSPYPE